MQLKTTCFYFTVLLSLFIANSVYASPVDIVKRDLAERGKNIGTLYERSSGGNGGADW